MRWLCIQIQPNRSPGIGMAQITLACEAIASTPKLVDCHSFDCGEDQGPYFNFTFGATYPLQLWETIQTCIYGNKGLDPHLRRSSTVVCTGEDGWDDYLLLFHFDPDVELDSASALESA